MKLFSLHLCKNDNYANPFKIKFNQGFTLIELSIVLVIIGLIIGGIFVGRDLITAATVKAQIKQMSDLESAINTFQGKYNCLPGDCANATSLLTADQFGNAIVNGDGDGMIRDKTVTASHCLMGQMYGSSGANTEYSQLFVQLNAAQLGNYNINGTGSGEPNLLPDTVINSGGVMVTCTNGMASDLGGVLPPAQFRTGTIMALGLTHASTYTTYIYYPLGFAAGGTLPPDIAFQIDTILDDGLPTSGKVGVLWTCNGNGASIPATYSAMVSSCGVSMAKILKSTGFQ